MRTALIALAALTLAGCDSLTDTQQKLRDQGRPYQIGESDGLKAFKWEIPQGNGNSEDLVFIVGTATEWCGSTEKSSCRVTDATNVNRPPMTEEAFAAMAKLTPEERKRLGLTR